MPRPKFTGLLSALALALTLSACNGGSPAKTEMIKGADRTVTGDATKSAGAAKVVVQDPPAPAPKPEVSAPSVDSPEGKVQVAAAIAKEISAAPEMADEILGKRGLDRDKFDALMFEIAGDPELTKAYMAARRTR